MKCLNLSELIAYQNRLYEQTEQEKIDHHVQSCPTCQRKINVYDETAKFMHQAVPGESKLESEKCYDDVATISYLEGNVKGKIRAEYYEHLNSCESCLNKLIALEGLIHELKEEGFLPESKGLIKWTDKTLISVMAAVKSGSISLRRALVEPRCAYRWLGTAVLLIAVGVLLFRTSEINRSLDNTRDNTVTRHNSPILQLKPANRSTAKTNKPEFRWTGPEDVTNYAFVLLNADGDILLEQTTTQTRFELPEDMQLLPNTMYFWQVEAFLKTGDSIVSDMASFEIRPE